MQFSLGAYNIKNNVVVAPLAAISDAVFCEQMLRYGAGLVYSEMIAATGLAAASKRAVRLARFGASSRPVVLQLFGNKPEAFARAARYICEHDLAEAIDINMGCPIRRDTFPGSGGAALMRNLPLAREIIVATVKNATKPVSIKFRLGWDDQKINFLELATIAEGEGVAALCLHARTKVQEYTGRADWSQIKALKAAVKLPVIGNGDIASRADAQAMLQQTGCDAIMIGRAAIANPWLINSIIEDRDVVPTPAEAIYEYLWHVRALIELRGAAHEKYVLRETRKYAGRYLNNLPDIESVRKNINRIETLQELEGLLNDR